MKRILFIVLLIMWMIIMFILSGQEAEQSNNTSGIVTNSIIKIIQSISNIQIEDMQNTKDLIIFIVRKLAHVISYFIGGILAYFTYNSFKKVNKKDLKYIILFMLVYAISDEFHQYFVPRKKC